MSCNRICTYNFRSCSTSQWFHKELEEARHILLDNQYPLEFIENLFNLTFTKILTVHKNNENEVNNTTTESSVDYDTYVFTNFGQT